MLKVVGIALILVYNVYAGCGDYDKEYGVGKHTLRIISINSSSYSEEGKFHTPQVNNVILFNIVGTDMYVKAHGRGSCELHPLACDEFVYNHKAGDIVVVNMSSVCYGYRNNISIFRIRK